METMSYTQACEYVTQTKKHAFAVLTDGSEITLNWDDDDLEIWSSHLKSIDEYQMKVVFYPVEELAENFPDIENVIWCEGKSPMFLNKYGQGDIT